MGKHALAILVVLSDVKLPSAHGLSLLPHCKAVAASVRFLPTHCLVALRGGISKFFNSICTNGRLLMSRMTL
jgi:hypothetical protein